MITDHTPRRTPTTGRATVVAVVLLAAATLLAACGGSTSGVGTGSDGAGGSGDTTPNLAVPAVDDGAAPSLPVTVDSADGRSVTVTDISRIVVLQGNIAEVVFALGLGDNVVGRDISATFDEAADIPLVTRAHDVSAESVLSLRPTVVLADTDTGPPEAIEHIRNIGVPLVVFETATDVDQIGPRIESVAEALGIAATGAELASETEAALASVTKDIATDDRPKVAFLYMRGQAGVYLLGGEGSGADSMIETAGGIDAGTAIGLDKAFTPITSEALVLAAPDVILMTTTGLESVGGIDGLVQIPGIGQTPAGESRRIVTVEDGLLYSFGVRTPDALEVLATELPRRAPGGADPVTDVARRGHAPNALPPTDVGVPGAAPDPGPVASPTSDLLEKGPRRRPSPWLVVGVLIVALIVACMLGASMGAFSVPPGEVLTSILRHLGLDVGSAADPMGDQLLWEIRFPRVAMAVIVGAALGCAGAAMQGTFSNPLAEPGTVGVSSGAVLGAVAQIVIGFALFGALSLPIAAFVGGLLTVLLVYWSSRSDGRTEVVTLILTGIAINAFVGAVIGLLTFFSDDAELRSIVFWTLGSMAQATWQKVAIITPFALIGLGFAFGYAGKLDLLALGERPARHLGIDVERLRITMLTIVAVLTAAAVAVSGQILFVGLVIPHLVRMVAGPGHKLLLPASALLGATILVLADLAARTIAAPAEVPLGVLTALIGAPFFFWQLRRTRARQGGWA